MDRPKRTGRTNLLGLRVFLLLLLGVLLQLRLEIRHLARVRQLVRECPAEAGVRLCNRIHLLRVRRVLVVLRLALARADPEDECDDHDDRDCDQADEPGKRDEACGRAHRRTRRTLSAAPAAAARHLEPGKTPPLRRLDGLGLVEEVELDVVVVSAQEPRCRPLPTGD